jgi:hypothetical protein
VNKTRIAIHDIVKVLGVLTRWSVLTGGAKGILVMFGSSEHHRHSLCLDFMTFVKQDPFALKDRFHRWVPRCPQDKSLGAELEPLRYCIFILLSFGLPFVTDCPG